MSLYFKISKFLSKKKSLNKKHINFNEQLHKEHNKYNLFEDKNFNYSLPLKCENNLNIVWKRPFEITDNPVFIDKNIDLKDIFQGEIGTCWILAPIISMIKNNNSILKIINPNQSFDTTYNGKFVFKFYEKDTKLNKIIEVDDKLPYDSYNKKLFFSYNKNNSSEFWLPLFEKAIIKLLNLSYKSADDGGDPITVSRYLLGEDCICDNYKIENNSLIEIRDILKSIFYGNVSRNSIIICALANPSEKSRRIAISNNIAHNHAYSIIDYDEKNDLIKMMNPWAKHEYNKQIILTTSKNEDFNNENDGIWWMSLLDFKLNFNLLQVSQTKINIFSNGIFEKPSKVGFFVIKPNIKQLNLIINNDVKKSNIICLIVIFNKMFNSYTDVKVVKTFEKKKIEYLYFRGKIVNDFSYFGEWDDSKKIELIFNFDIDNKEYECKYEILS